MWSPGGSAIWLGRGVYSEKSCASPSLSTAEGLAMETRSGRKVKVMEEQREPLLDSHSHPTAPSPQLCQQQGQIWGSLWLHRQPGPGCLLLAATRMETPSCCQPSSGAAALNQADLCPLLSHSYFLKSVGARSLSSVLGFIMEGTVQIMFLEEAVMKRDIELARKCRAKLCP